MTERDSIRFGDTTIEYQVRRSERRKKTVEVTIAGGGVQVAAPMDTPAEDLQTLVRRRAPWILNHASDGSSAVAPKRSSAAKLCPTWDATFAWCSNLLRYVRWKFISITGGSTSGCLADSTITNATSAYVKPSSLGIGDERRHGCDLVSRSGCLGSAAANRRRY